MSMQDFPYIGVADIRRDSPQLRVFDDGEVIALQCLDRLVIDSSDRHQLAVLAATLVKNLARRLPGAASIDAIIFIASGEDQSRFHPLSITVDPVPVFVISEVVAASIAVPDHWTKFQLIDVSSRTCWLIEKKEEEVVSASSASWSRLQDTISNTVRRNAAFGFKNVAVISDDEDLEIYQYPPESITLSSHVLFLGAKRVVQRGAANGSHLCWDHAGRKVLTVAAKRTASYRITHVHQPVFSANEPALAEVTDGRPILLVVDQNVNRIYGDTIDRYARTSLNCSGKIVYDASEKRKNGIEVARLCNVAVGLGFPRDGIFVAVGGGVTLDVVGLAASLYYRGVGYFRIPTTLLGLIDAGLGIKQGINFAGRKNLAGSFYPPIGVINDNTFLRTLPLEEISCGAAEIIKIALVTDRALFQLLEEHGRKLHESRFSEPSEVADRVLLRSSMLMTEQLQANLYEVDLRRLVDFGHSFSPTIEALSKYEVPHGCAVAMDMSLSTAIAVIRGVCPSEVLARLSALLGHVHLPVGPPRCSVSELVGALHTTRKRRAGNLNLVVPTAVGSAVFLQDVSQREIEEALALIGECPELLVENPGAINVSAII